MSNIRELETTHHQGRCIALGVFNTFPIENLYIKANKPLTPGGVLVV